MDVRIEPEPPPEERAAIVAALVQAGAGARNIAVDESPWWRAGLPDNDVPMRPLPSAACP